MVCHVCILVPANLQDLMSEATNMTKKIELIEAHKRFLYFNHTPSSMLFYPVYSLEHLESMHHLLWCRKLLGETLGACSAAELHELGNQLEESLRQIRKRKVSPDETSFLLAQREGKKHHSLPYDRSYCPTVRISFCFIYETQEKSLLKENKLLHEK
ncbi:hypothetical protein GW17_00045589, partial [Ensete ventricosum]